MILAFSLTQSLASGVYFYSGNELVELMGEYDRAEANASGVSYFKVGNYGGYILGIYDGTRYTYSMPESATKGQVLAVVTKYLKNHPEKWTEPAAVLVIEALQEAFPLKGGK
jgi:hypothetical protein